MPTSVEKGLMAGEGLCNHMAKNEVTAQLSPCHPAGANQTTATNARTRSRPRALARHNATNVNGSNITAARMYGKKY